jgi:hypothetical protein
MVTPALSRTITLESPRPSAELGVQIASMNQHGPTMEQQAGLGRGGCGGGRWTVGG